MLPRGAHATSAKQLTSSGQRQAIELVARPWDEEGKRDRMKLETRFTFADKRGFLTAFGKVILLLVALNTRLGRD